MELSVELWSLFGCALMVVFAINIQGVQMVTGSGVAYWLSARDKPKEGVLAGRLDRNVRNNVEGIAMFAPLVFVAESAGISNGWTHVSAEIYLATRIIFPFIYIIGIQPYRSILWGVGLTAIFTFIYGLLIDLSFQNLPFFNWT